MIADEDMISVAEVGNSSSLWHQRLGHMSEKGKVSLSTTEAEYIAISETTKEMIWLKNLLKELGKGQDEPSLFSDSQSAICLAKIQFFTPDANTLN